MVVIQILYIIYVELFARMGKWYSFDQNGEWFLGEGDCCDFKKIGVFWLVVSHRKIRAVSSVGRALH